MKKNKMMKNTRKCTRRDFNLLVLNMKEYGNLNSRSNLKIEGDNFPLFAEFCLYAGSIIVCRSFKWKYPKLRIHTLCGWKVFRYVGHKFYHCVFRLLHEHVETDYLTNHTLIGIFTPALWPLPHAQQQLLVPQEDNYTSPCSFWGCPLNTPILKCLPFENMIISIVFNIEKIFLSMFYPTKKFLSCMGNTFPTLRIFVV